MSIYSIRYKQKKYSHAADAAFKSIDWKTKKKLQITSGDWYNAALAYYFAAAYTPKTDSVNRVSYAMKGDTAFGKAIEINAKWPPFYLFRARTNNYIDYTGDKWLSVPYYEKYLTVIDALKAENSTTYKEKKDDTYEALRYLDGYHGTIS